MTLPRPTGGAYNTDRICISGKKVIKMLCRHFVHVDQSLIDVQIFGCQLDQNAFGGPAGGAIPLPPSRY